MTSPLLFQEGEMAGRTVRRVAAEKGTANLKHLQQLQLKFNPNGELKAVSSPKVFRLSDCADVWSNYGIGSILRIQMINFQKYSDCIVRPGPYMNMIIGPNGTGKSTIVAAIALALGASPTVIGRSSRLVEFIKYDMSQATLEIILRTRENYVAIKRVIRRVNECDCESDWFINGSLTTQRQVVQCAESLGAQVSNLCQFLPQDRVSDFAQMSPEQMLLATMRAAASVETNEQFSRLVEAQGTARKLREQLDRNGLELSTKQRIHSTLQGYKLRAREREDRRKKIELLKRKRPWLVYQSAREAYLEKKGERDRLRAELEAATDEANLELTNRIEELERTLKGTSRTLKQSLARVKASRGQVESTYGEANRLGVAIELKKREILKGREMRESIRKQHDQDCRALTEIEEKISELSARNTQEADDGLVLENEIGRIRKELLRGEQGVSDLHSELDRLQGESKRLCETQTRIQRKIEDTKNVRQQRLTAVSRMYPSIPRVMEWLEANRGRFSGSVVGPLAVELEEVDGAISAGAIESVLSRSSLASFVFENADDHEMFSRACESNDWRVNSSLMRNYSRDGPLPVCPWSRSELEALGFDGGLVLDHLRGPRLVLAALCESSRVHMIPVGSGANSTINVAGCERLRGLGKFLSSESVFEVKRSRYSAGDNDDIATRISPHRPGFILASGNPSSNARGNTDPEGDEAKLRDIRRLLAQQQEKMRTTLAKCDSATAGVETLRGELDTLRDRKRSALVQRAELKKVEIARERLRKQCRDSAKLLRDDQGGEGQLLEDLADLISKRQLSLKQLLARLNEYHNQLQGCTLADLNHNLVRSRIAALERERDLQGAKHSLLQSRVSRAETETKEAKLSAEEALQVAEMHEITPETRDAFTHVTDNLTELNDLITAEEALLASSSATDRFHAQDEEKLREIEAEMETLQQNVAQGTGDLEALHLQMDSISGPWLENIYAMVSAIDAKFSHFFSKISCQGSVALAIPSTDPKAFDSYSLAISVSFRAGEPLQRLTAQRQSGGEKSVATILFLLALQELSQAPFRVVDEINQGMDAENERKIHSLMVETATCASENLVVDSVHEKDAIYHATKLKKKKNKNDNEEDNDYPDSHTPHKQYKQYFLITPKLLTGLEYNDKMNILCIFNGPGVQ
jgi:structural maintenance of chromosomes protein 5